jgi:hypothetical protein
MNKGKKTMNAAAATQKIFDARTALAAMTLGAEIQYRWERVAIWHLVFGLGLTRTHNYLLVSGKALPCWQRKRLEGWGIHNHNVRYDDSIPQSMSDAAKLEDRYVANEKGEALAAYLGLTVNSKPDLHW